MKNTIKWLIYVIATMLLLTGCGSGENGNAAITDASKAGGEVPLKTIERYSEYRKLEKNSFPKEVIRYDSIASIGEFSSFTVLSGGNNGDYSQYMYELTDILGETVSVTVTDVTKRQRTERQTLNTDYNKNDMRTIETEDTGVISVDGVDYLYVKKQLLSISWMRDNLEFTVSGNPFLNEYPKENDSFVSRLINSETAAEVIEQIRY